MLRSRADISKAWVHEVVRKALVTPSSLSRKVWHFLVNSPSPEMCPCSMAEEIYLNSLPARPALLKGMR
jgi:hypothetical protein